MKRNACLLLALCLLLTAGGCAGGEDTLTQPEAEALPSVSVAYLSPSPTLEPTPSPTPGPTLEPTPAPTSEPTPEPTPGETPTATPPLIEYVFSGGNLSWEQLEAFLQEHPTVRKVDLRESGLDVAACAPALLALDLDEIHFAAELCGEQITDETETFRPNSMPEGEDLTVLSLVRGLRRIDLTALSPEPTKIEAVQAAFPEAKVLWKGTLCGVAVDQDTASLNFNDVPLDSLEPFYRMLPLLNKLTSLEMCGCGVSNEDMDALRTAFPQAGIVWSIQSKHWNVRTDADHFATWAIDMVDENGKILAAHNIHYNTNEDLDWLQYCHDMVALDVGHNLLTNCEFIRNMPDLEYLILADNPLSDLSPLSGLKKLKYLEVFTSHVTDLSPLAPVTSLLDLNAAGCYIGDITPLYGLTNLERLWLTPYGFSNWIDAQKAFSAAVPGCNIHFIKHHDMTGDDWRYHERYAQMRLALGRAKP